MKKRTKPTFKSLTIGEKIGVIIFYILGITATFAIPAIMYLQAPLFW